MYKIKIFIGFSLLFVIFITGCKGGETQPESDEANLPNPASVFCQEQGGVTEIRSDSEGGQYGVCLFPDGSECDEWAFFRGECAPGEAQVAPSPESAPSYINEIYEFSIVLPDEWEAEDHGEYVLFKRPGYFMFVGYQWADEEPKPFRTGMPSGEFIEDGLSMILGQPIPRNILVFEGKNKVVDYGGRIKIGDLIVVFYLDGSETESITYQDIDIPEEIIDQADQIIASFVLESGETPTIERNP